MGVCRTVIAQCGIELPQYLLEEEEKNADCYAVQILKRAEMEVKAKRALAQQEEGKRQHCTAVSLFST